MLSGMLSGVLSGMLSGVLSGMLSGTSGAPAQADKPTVYFMVHGSYKCIAIE